MQLGVVDATMWWSGRTLSQHDLVSLRAARFGGGAHRNGPADGQDQTEARSINARVKVSSI